MKCEICNTHQFMIGRAKWCPTCKIQTGEMDKSPWLAYNGGDAPPKKFNKNRSSKWKESASDLRN